MGKSLIITEKPSVAQEFAKVLRVSGRNDGYIENGEYVISWCVGHLVGLVYPESYDMKYKKWRLEDLPFLPKEYKYDVIDSVRKQYNIVHALLQREDIDRVYWAGDAVKEGQTIIDVGINVNAEGKLCGDVDYAAVEPIVDAITPVPGGVGSVTTSVLVGHVVEAAMRKVNA